MKSTPDKTEQFVGLFAKSQPKVYAFVCAMISDVNDAEDVFQEVSIGLWQKFHRFEPGTNFTAWAMQFAKFAVLKYFEKQRRGRTVFAQDLVELLVDETCSQLESPDLRLSYLRQCVGKLPQHSRQLLEARHNSDLKTCNQVAKHLGRSLDATYKALTRLHQSLLQCVQNAIAAEESV